MTLWIILLSVSFVGIIKCDIVETSIASIVSLPASIEELKKVSVFTSTIPFLITINHPNLTEILIQQREMLANCTRRTSACDLHTLTQNIMVQMHNELDSTTFQTSANHLNIQNRWFGEPLQSQTFSQWFMTSDSWNQYLTDLIFEFQDDDIALASTSTSVDISNPDLTTSSVSGYNFIIHYFSKFMSVLSDCRNQLIPAVIYYNTEIAQKLNETNNLLHQRGYELSIPVDKLFKMKIASCIKLDTSIEVLLRLPINPINDAFQLVAITPIPYLSQGMRCSVVLPSNYFLMSSNITVTVPSFMERWCTNDICFIPMEELGGGADTCILAIMTGDHATIQKRCQVTCAESSEIMYSSTGVGKLVITGGAKFKFTCGDEVIQYNVQRSGSVEIIQPCNCSLQVDDGEMVNAPYPCPKINEMEHPNITHLQIDLASSNKIRHLSDTNIVYCWLTIITLALTYFAYTRNRHRGFLPVSPVYLLCIISLVSATSEGEQNTSDIILDSVLSLLRNISFSDSIVFVAALSVGSLLFIFGAKVYSVLSVVVMSVVGTYKFITTAFRFCRRNKIDHPIEMAEIKPNTKTTLNKKYTSVDM